MGTLCMDSSHFALSSFWRRSRAKIFCPWVSPFTSPYLTGQFPARLATKFAPSALSLAELHTHTWGYESSLANVNLVDGGGGVLRRA